jgi:hypothetical protein
MKCADCKHWEALFRLSADRGTCRRITNSDSPPRIEADYSDDRPELITPPDFGRVLFEQKEAT